MDIPKEIQAVPRPANTIVVKIGKLYAVRRILEASERQNKNTKYGEVIGYIINGAYVPKEKYYSKPDREHPFMACFAAIILILSIGLDILNLLLKIFPVVTAKQIFVVACLKILYPGVTERDMKRYYNNSYLSVLFPGVALSKNEVAALYKDIGLMYKERFEYKWKVLGCLIKSDVIFIDGSYRQFNSIRSFLSKYPIKKKFRGYFVINVIFAFIPGAKELLSSVYPGSYSDVSVFRSFLLDNKIYVGILIGDAAFIASVVQKLKEENAEFKDLSYIGIMRSNDQRIKEFDLLSFESAFESARGTVLCKKVKDENKNIYYYAYKNLKISYTQETIFARKAIEHPESVKDFKTSYNDEVQKFGVKIVETPLDCSPSEIYDLILERWTIETVFYKQEHDLGFNKTRVHDEFSVIGQDFVNSVSTSLYLKACEKIKKIQHLGLLVTSSYKGVIEYLKGIWRYVTDYERKKCADDVTWILNEGLPTSNKLDWPYATEKDFKVMEAFGISKPEVNDNNDEDGNKSNTNGKSRSNIAHGSNKKNLKNKKSKELEQLVNNSNQLKEAYNNLQESLNSLLKRDSHPNCKVNGPESNTNQDVKRAGRPKGSLNKKTIDRNNLVQEIIDDLNALHQKQEEIDKKISIVMNSFANKEENLNNTTSDSDSTLASNDPEESFNCFDTFFDFWLKNEVRESSEEPKKRKTRSDQGKPRGSYKTRKSQSAETNSVFDTFFDFWLKNDAQESSEAQKKRKPRSDRGKPRGSYKTRKSQSAQTNGESEQSDTRVDSGLNNDAQGSSEEPKKRKPRSDKGKPRGSYKARRSRSCDAPCVSEMSA